jgi:hypothetical protein
MMRRSGEDIVYSGRQLRSLIGPAILAIPIILLLLWHLSNNGLPTDDAANYAETSLQIFREFENGPVAGVVAMFNIRGWRPTIFS